LAEVGTKVSGTFLWLTVYKAMPKVWKCVIGKPSNNTSAL